MQHSSPVSRYNNHSCDIQRILQVISVIYRPVTAKIIQQILKLLDWENETGEALQELLTKPLLALLLEEKLITLHQTAIQGCFELMEIQSRQLVDEELFDQVVSASLAVYPLHRSNPHIFNVDDADFIRELRIAFYQGKEKRVKQLLTVKHAYSHLSFEKIIPLNNICLNPLNIQWFSQLSDQIKFLVMHSTLNLSAYQLIPQLELYKFLMQMVRNQSGCLHPAFRRLLAEQHLLRGHIEQALPLLEGDDSAEKHSLLAWTQFLQNHNDASIESYEHALNLIQTQKGQSKACLPGPAPIFFLLALLKTQQNERFQQARDYYALLLNNNVKEIWHDVQKLLINLIEFFADGETVFIDFWQSQQDSKAAVLQIHAYQDILLAALQFWINELPGQAQILQLQNYQTIAKQGGYAWYAQQCKSALQKFRHSHSPQNNNDEVTSELVNLITPLAQWQRTLNTLQAYFSKAQPLSKKHEKNTTRLIWWISSNNTYCEFSPRLQKLNKAGHWSVGRAVSLKRLHLEPEKFSYLSDQDLKMCAGIRREKSQGYYYGSPKEHYSLKTQAATLAAVGHPFLFFINAPDVPVELTQVEPKLLVKRQNDHLLMKIDPEPLALTEDGALSHLAIYQASPYCLQIVHNNEQHLRIATILGPEGLQAPLHAEQQVLTTINAISPLIAVHSDISSIESPAVLVQADNRPHLHLQPAGEGGLLIECFVQPFSDDGPLFHPGEGFRTVLAEIDQQQLRAERQLDQETKQATALLEACPALMGKQQWTWQLLDMQQALEALLQLQQLGEQVVLAWPKGKKIRLTPEIPLSNMKLSIAQEKNWFQIKGQLLIKEDQVLAMEQLLVLLQQSPGRFLRLKDGQVLTLSNELRSHLDKLQVCSHKGRFHPMLSGAVDDATEDMEVKSCQSWQRQKTLMQAAQELEPKVPSTLQANLRDYQQEGFQWLARLAHWGAGACLADDMGLGKTLQAMSILIRRASKGPALVLAPSSVCINWHEEVQRFAPTLKPHIFGPGDRQKMLDNAGPFNLIICSYGLLQTEGKRLARKLWCSIVADEAQAIKNAKTKRSKAAMALQGDFKLITTGTPIENHLGELWSLFDFINPGLLGSQSHFSKQFIAPIETKNCRVTKQQLKQLIRPFILRRLKSEVLTELPARTQITLHIQAEKEEAALYEAMRRQAVQQMTTMAQHPGQAHIKMLAEITRMRRLCCHPQLVLPDRQISSAKLNAFAELLQELRDNLHKTLVFSQFVGHLTLIRNYLDKQQIPYQYLDGSCSTKARKIAVDAFQAGQGDVFLISLKAGGVGLNLTAADYVIHMDPWWNPAVEDQASDRAHRIGQLRPVTIYRLVMSNTIEDKIIEMHQHKRDLADSLLEGTHVSHKFSVEEMMNLLEKS